MDPPYPKVGLPEIDEEHRALGEGLQQMLAAMLEDDRDRTLALARMLAAQVEEHFAHEERLMREIRYENGLRHTLAHKAFLDEARLRLESLRSEGLSAGFLRWASELNEWFQRHVVSEDRSLASAALRARELAR